LAEKEHRHQPVRRPWFRTAWFSWVVVLGIVVVVLAVLVLPVAAQDTVSYCTSCKAMKPAAKTWANAAHHQVSCTQCHVPSGTLATIKWRFTEGRNVWADYLGMAAGNDKRQLPTNAECIKCHPLSKLPNESNGVKIDHTQHVLDRGVSCVACHTTTSHRTANESGSVSMVTCAMCHNAQGAPDSCDLCHAAPPATKHAPDFMTAHGKQALDNPQLCVQCHHDTKAFCDKCHAYPPPSHFSGTWQYTHGPDATKNPASCSACHDAAYCKQCHQVSHPADWVQTHGAVAKGGVNGCLVCHPRSMCDACHEQNGVVLP
jgi:hypothetical protein